MLQVLSWSIPEPSNLWDWWTHSWAICSYWSKILAVKGSKYWCVQCVLVFWTSAPVIISSRKVQCWNWVWEFGECNSEALPWNLWKLSHYSLWSKILAVKGFTLQILPCVQCNTTMVIALFTDLHTVQFFICNFISYLVPTTYVSNAHSSSHIGKLLHRNVERSTFAKICTFDDSVIITLKTNTSGREIEIASFLGLPTICFWLLPLSKNEEERVSFYQEEAARVRVCNSNRSL